MQPKKSLGQNFLSDREILSTIADYGELSRSDTVLEIGPGRGDLTSILCACAGRVVAIEFDDDLMPGLRKIAAQNPNLELVHGDILTYDLASLPAEYKVVANIPYNITSPILTRLVASDNMPVLAVLLVQKEVAQRVAAGPGDLSALAIMTQIYAEVESGIIVPAKCFDPVPKVDGQVVILRRRSQPLVSREEISGVMKLVRAGFASPRKKLRSSLAIGLMTNKQVAESLLKRAGIDPNLRAQALSIADWQRLTKVVADLPR